MKLSQSAETTGREYLPALMFVMICGFGVEGADRHGGFKDKIKKTTLYLLIQKIKDAAKLTCNNQEQGDMEEDGSLGRTIYRQAVV